MEAERTEAWYAGYNEYWRGVGACPHYPGTRDWADWQQGWEDAATEDAMTGREEIANDG